MATWDEMEQEIAQAAGVTPDKLPRRDTHEWYALMTDLQDSHPGLVQRAREMLIESAAPEPLPTDAEITSARRRAGVLGSLFKWAQRRDPMQPQRKRTNRTAVMVAIVLVVFVMMALFRSHRAAPTHPAASRPSPPAQTAQQPPPPTAAPSTAPPATRTTQPATQAAQPGASSALPSTAPPPLPPFPPSSGPRGAAATNGSGATVVSTKPPAAALRIVAPQAPAAALVVVSGTASGTGGSISGSASSGGLQVVTPQAAQAAGQGAPGQPGPGGAPGQAQGGPSFQVGDQFTVKMLTPLAVSPAWQAIPAVAEGIDGPLSGWRVLGSATLGQDGAIQISWTQALAPDGKHTVALHGVAYDPQVGKPGIPHAQTKVMAPQAARTTLSGTLGAVSQYVQDQIQAQQVVVANGATFLTSSVPPFWQILAQQLASGFQPAPVQTGGTVIVARIPAGTPVVVFITQPSGPGGA